MERTAPEDDLAAIRLLDEPARRRLYEWVAGQTDPVGRDAAARALGITRALAAFHLDKLAAAGLLEAGYQRLTGRTGPGAGRPARVYWRAAREFTVTIPERHYDRIAALFAGSLEQDLEAPIPAELRDAARASGEALARRTGGRGRGTARLLAALRDAGYEPRTSPEPTIRLGNCPFDALVDEHRPLVCGTNLAIAQGISRGLGLTELEPVLDPQPGLCCVAFVPGEKRPAPNPGR